MVAVCEVPLPMWVTVQSCLLPFPAVFNVSNEEKASSQGFCLFTGLVLRKPCSLNLHFPRKVEFYFLCLKAFDCIQGLMALHDLSTQDPDALLWMQSEECADCYWTQGITIRGTPLIQLCVFFSSTCSSPITFINGCCCQLYIEQ